MRKIITSAIHFSLFNGAQLEWAHDPLNFQSFLTGHIPATKDR